MRIEDSISKSERGVQLRDKVVEGLQGIVTKARDVDHLVSGIVSASQQQRQGIEQITSGMSEIERVTQSGAAGAEESAAAAEELKHLAGSVQGLVTDLRSIVASKSDSGAGG
jgi:methyl-accepting chemotaxis protein